MIGITDVLIAATPFLFLFGGSVLYAAIAGGVFGVVAGVLRELARRRRLKELKKLAEELGLNWRNLSLTAKSSKGAVK